MKGAAINYKKDVSMTNGTVFIVCLAVGGVIPWSFARGWI